MPLWAKDGEALADEKEEDCRIELEWDKCTGSHGSAKLITTVLEIGLSAVKGFSDSWCCGSGFVWMLKRITNHASCRVPFPWRCRCKQISPVITS